MHVSVGEEHCATGQAQAPGPRPCGDFLPKSASFSHFREMLRKTSIVFFFLQLLSTRKKRITKAYLLQLKPFTIELKVTKK